eukprot:TRINITY_DN10086_c0_g1_i2.p1 TRINITY_DN10086_c0_g1~~TRINITY_DN10086_c0_g1_i2.p1  ORF type:complete len:353 (+),score=47.27 TRINITY_DN10086_c0_g1_i2:116-1174(+)
MSFSNANGLASDDCRQAQESEAAAGRGWRQPSIAWLAPTVMMYWIANTGPMSFFQAELGDWYGDDAAVMWTIAQSITGGLSFLLSPAIGALSDRVGRCPVQAFKVFVQMMPYVVLGLVPEGQKWRVDLALFFQALSGLSGSQMALPAAYCSDLVLRDSSLNLNATMSLMLGVAFTPPFIAGPLMCAALAGATSRVLLFRAVVVLGIVNTLYIILIMPESVTVPHTTLTNLTTSFIDGSFVSGEDEEEQGQTRSGVTGHRAMCKARLKAINPFQYFRLLHPTKSPAGKEVAKIMLRISGMLFFLYSVSLIPCDVELMAWEHVPKDSIPCPQVAPKMTRSQWREGAYRHASGNF